MNDKGYLVTCFSDGTYTSVGDSAIMEIPSDIGDDHVEEYIRDNYGSLSVPIVKIIKASVSLQRAATKETEDAHRPQE